MTRAAIVLSGGGARGAYQAGVLRALAEIAPRPDGRAPFEVVTGISAGSINATYLAGTWDDFAGGTKRLATLWSGLTSGQVYRTDTLSLGGNALRWLTQAAIGGMTRRRRARALFDTAPLAALLSREIAFDRIPAQVDRGVLHSVAITATDYDSGYGVTFVQGCDSVTLWARTRRVAVCTPIGVSHVLASASIPLLFPPVQVGQRWFGDGGLRNTAPISPAIHLGARRLVIVGVRRSQGPEALPGMDAPAPEPSLGRILATMINGILMDAIDIDVERMTRINRTLTFVRPGADDGTRLKPIDFSWLQPRQFLSEVALTHLHLLPTGVRHLLAGLGSESEVADLASYVLFEPEYCKILIDLGYHDTLARRDELEPLLEPGERPHRDQHSAGP